MTKFNEMYPGDPGGQMMAAFAELNPRMTRAETTEEIDDILREMRKTFEIAGPGGHRALLAGLQSKASRMALDIAMAKLREEESDG